MSRSCSPPELVPPRTPPSPWRWAAAPASWRRPSPGPRIPSSWRRRFGPASKPEGSPFARAESLSGCTRTRPRPGRALPISAADRSWCRQWVMPSLGEFRRVRLAGARLYLVSVARRAQGDLEIFLDSVLTAGVDIIQLREKDAEAGDLLRWSKPFR